MATIDEQLREIAKGNSPRPKEKSIWDGISSGVSKAYKQISQPYKQGVQNIVDFVSPVETNISELPSLNDAIDEKMAIDENDVGFKVYRRIGELAKLKEGFTDPTNNDIKQYNENLKKLMIEDLGYDGLGFDSSTDTYYVVKDGKESDLDPTLFQTIVGEAMGDKAEIYGAIAGAKMGSKVGIGFGKLGATIAGGAIGASIGNIADTTAGILSTGQALSAGQFANEMAKSAVLDATGAVIGGAVIKVGGKLLKAPQQAYDLLLKGNIDGAKEVLKSDLKLTDEGISEALLQMKSAEVEQYGEGILKGKEKSQEALLSATMSHPQGERIIKESVLNNPKAGFELEQSINQRAKQVLGTTTESTDGTTIKRAVEGYEKRVGEKYTLMRKSFKDAFIESGYRFDLKDLAIEKTINDLEGRVADPYIKEKFKGMASAISNTIEQSKNGIGVERDIDSLLDIRQQMNNFYRKNKTALGNKKDSDSFRGMVDNIDKEINNALDQIESPELKKELLSSLDDAKVSYKEMFDNRETALYKTLMGEGKSSDERLKSLLKHATDDGNELQNLIQKLNPEDAIKVEDSLVNAVLMKNKRGASNEMQSIDYAKVVDEFKKIKPFIKNKHTQKSIALVENMYKKYQHDFALSKIVKGITPTSSSGGIATSAEGRMKASSAKRIFDYVQTMIPFSDDAKRLALQRHIGKALEKSRTPLSMARELAFNKAVPLAERKDLKALIKANNELLRAKNDKSKLKASEEMDRIAKEIEDRNIAFQKEVDDFTVPTIEELNTVSRLVEDDKTASLSQNIRRIQEGTASRPDIERYLRAREGIDAYQYFNVLEKEQLQRLPLKYREVGEKEIGELTALQGYITDGGAVKGITNPREIASLIYDLRKNGYPRNMKYDELYDSLKKSHDANSENIYKNYTDVELSNEPLDDFGNPLFATTATVGGVTALSEIGRADNSLDEMVGLNDDFWDENIVIEKFKDIDSEIFKINSSKELPEKEKKEQVKVLEKEKSILKKYPVVEKRSKEYIDTKNKNIKNIIATIESKGDYNAKNPNSSARGKYQFINSTLSYVSEKTGLSKKYLKSPRGQEQAMDFLLKENQRVLEHKNIPIGPFTIYGSHQLGATGFSRVYRGHPTKKDISNMKNNLPKKLQDGDITSNWITYYKKKVENAK